MHELFPRGKSYPLADAIQKFGDPELVRSLIDHSFDESVSPSVLWDKQQDVLRSLNYGIRVGSLRATAFELPITISSRRQAISPDVWEKLTINVKQATGEFRGLKLFDIEIAADQIAMSIWGLRSRSRSAEDDDVQDDEDEVDIDLSEDGETLTIGDTRWRFTGEIQQEIIRQLVEAYPDELRSIEVLEHAGSNMDTIAKAFNGSRHWPTLSRYIWREEGMCRLLNKPQEDESDITSENSDTSEQR